MRGLIGRRDAGATIFYRLWDLPGWSWPGRPCHEDPSRGWL